MRSSVRIWQELDGHDSPNSCSYFLQLDNVKSGTIRNMLHIEEIRKSLLSQSFELDLYQVKLIQQCNQEPLSFSGAGRLYQTKKGDLRLKLYCQYPELPDFGKKRSIIENQPAKIISADRLFKLESIDTDMHHWFSENILLAPTIKIPPHPIGEVIDVGIDTIKCVFSESASAKEGRRVLRVFCPGHCKIPANALEVIKNEYHETRYWNTCKFSWEQCSITVRHKDDHIKATLSGNKNDVSIELIRRILEAISVAFGKNLDWRLLEEKNDSCHVLYVQNATSCKSSISRSAILHERYSEANDLIEFVSKYLYAFSSSREDFYCYWMFTTKCCDFMFEAHAVAISTSIEGVFKKYLSDIVKADQDLCAELDEAISSIQGTEKVYSERVKNILLSSLKYSKNVKEKTIVYEFIDRVNLSEQYAKNWSELRNKFVHPKSIVRDNKKLQKSLNRISFCQILFNILLLYLIDFNGKYIEYCPQTGKRKSLIFFGRRRLDIQTT